VSTATIEQKLTANGRPDIRDAEVVLVRIPVGISYELAKDKDSKFAAIVGLNLNMNFRKFKGAEVVNVGGDGRVVEEIKLLEEGSGNRNLTFELGAKYDRFTLLMRAFTSFPWEGNEKAQAVDLNLRVKLFDF